MESEEEEEYEEIIDDEAYEASTDANVKDEAGKKEKDNACYGGGSLDRPLVRFFFTAGCPELGLKGPAVGGAPIGSEVPGFEEKENKLLCTICGESVSCVEQLVTHWREEVERRRGKTEQQGWKVQGISYAEVKPLQKTEETHDVKPNVKSQEQQVDEDLAPSNGTEDANTPENPLGKVEYKSEKFEDQEMLDLSIVKMEDLEEKLLECDTCEYACNRHITLQKHKYRHSLEITLNSTFKCEECEYVSENISEFRMHKKEQHRVQIYKCQECGFACNLKNTLRSHRKRNHTNMHGSLSCDECEYTCRRRETLRMHKVRRHGEPPVEKEENETKIQCTECTYTGFQQHFGLHSRKHKIISCADCDFKANYMELQKHRRKVHDERKYPCNLCDYRGLRPARLERHIKAKHEKIVQYCDKCEYKTNYHDNFTTHLKTHDPESWFQCEQCPVRTPTNTMLRNHRDKEHHEVTESEYKCLTCDFVAPTKSKVYVHAKSHREQKEPERQKCEACDFTHFNSHHLKRHFLARHTKTRYQ